MGIMQKKTVTSKTRGRKLRSDVNWQGTLKRKRHKTNGRVTRAHCIVNGCVDG